MPKVTFMPMNTVCQAKEGETLLEIALGHNVPIEHACGGFCACTTCHVRVLSSSDALSELEEDEIERVDRAVDFSLNSRLSCQTKVWGDVVVEVVNLDT